MKVGVELLHVVLLNACTFMGETVVAPKAARDLRAPGVDAPHLAARRLRSLDERLGERVGVAADARAPRHYQHLARHNRPLSLVMRLGSRPLFLPPRHEPALPRFSCGEFLQVALTKLARPRSAR